MSELEATQGGVDGVSTSGCGILDFILQRWSVRWLIRINTATLDHRAIYKTVIIQGVRKSKEESQRGRLCFSLFCFIIRGKNWLKDNVCTWQ